MYVSLDKDNYFVSKETDVDRALTLTLPCGEYGTL